jgi:hypothetical protein
MTIPREIRMKGSRGAPAQGRAGEPEARKGEMPEWLTFARRQFVNTYMQIY